VEVQLGPRCGGFYPVLRGLQPGDRVATTGSFLIDAETRLSGGAASTYFGASGGPQSDHHAGTVARPSMTRDGDTLFQNLLAHLPAEDRPLVEAQGYCPVLGNRLGSMGQPVSVVLKGQKIFLCCKQCIKKARRAQKATLARVADLKERSARGDPPLAPVARSGAGLPASVRSNLARLSAEDRRLALEQRFCAVETGNLLGKGKMGPPVMIVIKGQKVFLCCTGCKDAALENPDRTLATVKKLRDRAKHE
jgi:hypothetical protein